MAQFYVQPKFSPYIQTLASPILGKNFGTLKRGFMQWDTVLTGYHQKATVHYLYNPSTVQAQYSATYGSGGTGNSSVLSQLYPIAGQNSQLVVPMSQTASWSVMFDRTFELMGRGSTGSTSINDPAAAGVGVDILQMMQFTGMLTNTGGATSSTAGGTDKWPGVMILTPAFAYFGGTGNNAVRFYGYINEWDVTYTHFTQNMVPMRCAVNISWTMLPKATASAAADQSNWVGQRTVGGGNPGSAAPATTGVSGR